MNNAKTKQIFFDAGIGSVLLSSFLLFAACGEAPAPQPPRLVKAMQISGASDLSEGNFPGRARAGQEVNLSFRVSGQMMEFPVSVGDKVNTGTSLAILDPSDYQQLVNATQSTLEAARAGGICRDGPVPPDSLGGPGLRMEEGRAGVDRLSGLMGWDS